MVREQVRFVPTSCPFPGSFDNVADDLADKHFIFNRNTLPSCDDSMGDGDSCGKHLHQLHPDSWIMFLCCVTQLAEVPLKYVQANLKGAAQSGRYLV